MTTLEYLNWYDRKRKEYGFYIFVMHVLHVRYNFLITSKVEMIDIINPHRPVDFKRLGKPNKRMLLFGKDLWLEEV